MKAYFFIFLGEFGYELLNWQGVVRKFVRTLRPEDRVICVGRPGVAPLYEQAHAYVNIGANPRYARSRASRYHAVPEHIHPWFRRQDRGLARNLMAREIRAGIARGGNGPFSLEKGDWSEVVECVRSQPTWAFSWNRTVLNGCRFGVNMHRRKWRSRRFAVVGEGGIYASLDLSNNEYMRLEPDLSRRADLEARLGFDLSEDFVLVQGRKRATAQKSSEQLDSEPVIRALARSSRIVALNFEEGRREGSYSRFDETVPNVTNLSISNLTDQSCLIHFASSRVFFTEGDLGSHIYVPPLMGRDVWALAPPSVFGLATSPLEFWNKNVFVFGGQIRPVACAMGPTAPPVLTSAADAEAFAREVRGWE